MSPILDDFSDSYHWLTSQCVETVKGKLNADQVSMTITLQ